MPLPKDLELLASFVSESRNAIVSIRNGLLDPEAGADALATSRRLLHTMKGTASVLGLGPLSHLAYHCEELAHAPPESDRLQFLRLAIENIERYLTLDLAELTEEAHLAPLRELVAVVELFQANPLPDEPTLEQPTFPELGEASFEPPADGLPFNTTDPQPDMLGAPPEWDTPAAPQPIAGSPELQPESALEAAVAISPEILEVFTAEAEEHVAVLVRTLPLFQQQPANKEYLQEIRRAAHTLKGAAASVGFHQIAKLSHKAEDLLDLLYDADRAATPAEIELLFATADALEDLAAGTANEAAVEDLTPRLTAATEAARASVHTETSPTREEESTPRESVAEPEMPGVAADAASVRAAGEALRVPIGRIDEVVKLVGELVISRSVFEQHLGKLSRLFAELQLSAERLRRATGKLETQYETRALESNRLANRLRPHDAHGFDDLEFDRYTDFHLLSRELSETSTDILTVSQELSGLTGEFDGYLVRQSRLTGEMQDKLMRVRMVPLAHLSSRLHRTVRRTAAELGKQVRLVLEGENTDLDKTVLEEMSEPLLHLLRNAIAHGIEDAETRAHAGKPASGTLRVQASHEGTQIVLRVSDDGRGLNFDAIRAVAVSRGFLSTDSAALATSDELTDLLFQPGFSTAGQVTTISGRGVGLDVVKVMVERLKGTVAVASIPGQGTTFTVRLPLTLAVIRALMVQAAGQTFALPLGSITQILRLDPEQCGKLGNQDVVRIGDSTVPQFTLSKRLGLRGALDPPPRSPAVVLSVADRRYVVVIDQILGGREVVVKSLGTHVRRAPGIAGATLMGDGSVVLILDPTELCSPTRVRAVHSNTAEVTAGHAQRVAVAKQLTVLIVDDSPSVRRIVAGQLRDAGFNPLTARDGLDALEVLHHAEHSPDVVMLDVEMPRMDGYELLSTIRASAEYAHLPVVMLTSRAGDKHRSKAMQLGATGYLVKPYQPTELVRVLREAAAGVPTV
ncbi:MAG: response regulator [Gemmataceae bacterium]